MYKPLVSFASALFFVAFGFQLAAAPAPISYQRWKGQQVVEAQNQVARLTNEIRLLKLGGKPLGGSILSEGETNSQVAMLEARLTSAKENLRFVEGLGMEHYVAVHLSQFKSDSNALREAAKAMKPDEIAQLLKVLLLSNTSSEAGPTVSAPSSNN